jgi:outer membrane protein OmpA-like peptidoglycan-associated protein
MKNISILFAVLITSLALTSCSAFNTPELNCDVQNSQNNADTKTDIAVILAPTDNFTDFPLALTSLRGNLVESVGLEGAKITTVIADGIPSVNKSSVLSKKDFKEDAEIQAQSAAGQVENVYKCIIGSDRPKVSERIPVEPESDMLLSLASAANSFDAKATNSTKKIIVIGNGISTAGQINFAKDGIPTREAIPGIITQLQKDNALPDLKGATVDWTGLGQADGVKQTKLNQQSLDSLVFFWTSLIEASNGKVGVIQTEIASKTPNENAIKVSAVKALPDACIQTTLTQDQGFNFEPNTAVFIDSAAAASGAAQIASEIASKPGCVGEITIVGYTASGVSQQQYTYGDNLALSQQRAEAFKQLLINAGVKAPIKAVGGDKGPVNDWDAQGNFVVELGKQNRIVVITQQ